MITSPFRGAFTTAAVISDDTDAFRNAVTMNMEFYMYIDVQNVRSFSTMAILMRDLRTECNLSEKMA